MRKIWLLFLWTFKICNRKLFLSNKKNIDILNIRKKSKTNVLYSNEIIYDLSCLIWRIILQSSQLTRPNFQSKWFRHGFNKLKLTDLSFIVNAVNQHNTWIFWRYFHWLCVSSLWQKSRNGSGSTMDWLYLQLRIIL